MTNLRAALAPFLNYHVSSEDDDDVRIEFLHPDPTRRGFVSVGDFRRLSAAASALPVDPRDPDPSREGVFRDHNCSRCKSGTRPDRCPNPGNPRNCDTLYARND